MGQWRKATPGPQKHPRLSACVPVRIATVDPERDPDTGELFYRSVEATTANLSRGGAYVRSWEPLAIGRRVLVEISLPSDESRRHVEVVARVAWTRRRLRPTAQESTAATRAELASSGDSSDWAAPTADEPGYGIEFTAGSKAELRQLDAYLKSVLPTASSADPGRSQPACVDASPPLQGPQTAKPSALSSERPSMAPSPPPATPPARSSQA